MHKKLQQLFEEDQLECLNQPPDGTPEYLALKKKCKDRIGMVTDILKSETILSGVDYFNACIIFMHGDCPDDFWQAYKAALESIDQNHNGAKKFAAAAYDRWLMYQGRPQKFGLQYVPDGIGLRLWDVDPETTDDERAEWEVPPLTELYQIAANASKNYDLSSINMETKPQWLKDAIKRWGLK